MTLGEEMGVVNLTNQGSIVLILGPDGTVSVWVRTPMGLTTIGSLDSSDENVLRMIRDAKHAQGRDETKV